MPKINVYLPDDLAAAVREAGVPVSPVCQQALARAARAMKSARQAIDAIRDPGFVPAGRPGLLARLQDRMTPRLTEAFGLARPAGRGPAGTGHLLLGLLEQGDNLGIKLLEAMDIDPGELTAGLGQADLTEAAARQDVAAGSGPADHGTGGGRAQRGAAFPAGQAAGAAAVLAGLSRPAWQALASALEAALDLGHNYLGCEHLVLGLVAERGGAAGRVLAGLGADPAAARQALGPVLAGYADGRQAAQQAGAEAIAQIQRRLDALEARLASPGAVSG